MGKFRRIHGGTGISASVADYHTKAFSGASTEARVQAAINAASADGVPIVTVADDDTPYDASSVTFDNSVRMVREGQETAGFDPKAYGATADGTADDSTAIQAAVDAAGNGGEITLDASDYFIDSEIQLNTKQWLRGVGKGTNLLAGSGITDRMIGLADGDQFGVQVSDLRLNGQKSSTSGVAGIQFANNNGAGFQGQLRHRLYNITIVNCSDFGIDMSGTIGGGFLYAIHIEQCASQCFKIDTTDNLIMGCVAGTTLLEGFHITDTNNRLVGCKGFGAGNATGGTASRGRGFRIAADRTVLSGCDAQDNADAGFLFESVQDIGGAGLFSDSNQNANFRWDDCDESVFDGLVSVSRSGGTFTASVGFEHFSNSSNNRVRGRERGSTSVFNGDASQSDLVVNDRDIGNHNREALSGNKTLTAAGPTKHNLDPNGAARNVDLPAEADGLVKQVACRGGASNNITLRDDAGSNLVTITPGDVAEAESDGTGWTISLSSGSVT